jgi:hypothetical protein
MRWWGGASGAEGREGQCRPQTINTASAPGVGRVSPTSLLRLRRATYVNAVVSTTPVCVGGGGAMWMEGAVDVAM